MHKNSRPEEPEDDETELASFPFPTIVIDHGRLEIDNRNIEKPTPKCPDHRVPLVREEEEERAKDPQKGRNLQLHVAGADNAEEVPTDRGELIYCGSLQTSPVARRRRQQCGRNS